MRALDTSRSAVEVPPLFAHQRDDIAFGIKNERFYNASDPGTGKTRTCLELIRELGEPALVFAPKSILRAAWEDDAAKYVPDLRVSVAFAENRAQAFKQPADIYVTNLDAVKWVADNPKVLERFKNGIVIADEACAYKHHTAQRSKAARKVFDAIPRATLMSGTPNPNGICDLWGQMLLLDGGQRLGSSFYKFRAAACQPVQTGRGAEMVKWVDKPGVEDAVYDLVSDIMVRHRLEDVLDMPENVVVPMHVDLSAKHLAAYRQLQAESLLLLENQAVTALNAGSLATKLLQCLSGAVYDSEGNAALVDTARYELVLDLVEARAQSVVAFLWKHQRDQLIAEAERRKIPYGVIDGDVNGEDRAMIVKRFQDGELQTIFAHPQSAGHGLTMTRGVATIWASPTANAEHFVQFNHRVYRAGQTQRTETILISARGTREAEVYESLDRKLDSMSMLLNLIGG